MTVDDARAANEQAGHGPLSSRRVILGYVLAVAGTAGLVAVFLPSREELTTLSHGFAFLALVVLTVAVGGLWPGVVASVLGFLAFNYFFIPPFGTFRIGEPQNAVVLFAFLGLAVLISYLLAQARSRAEIAEARARELQTQQDLTRALVDPRAGTSHYELVMRMVVSRFRFAEAELLITPKADLGGMERAAMVGEAADEVELAEERITLNVGRRNLGVLVLRGTRPPLDPSERRILDAFANQLALVLERDRLLRQVVAGA
jgi:two-component system, OmpR family, sensor histidine kinase KdpD